MHGRNINNGRIFRNTSRSTEIVHYTFEYIWMIVTSLSLHKWARTLRWRHNDHAGVSNHQPHGCLLNRLFMRKSKKTSKPRVTGLCAGNSPGTGEFPAQIASYAENVSIWWRHHDLGYFRMYLSNYVLLLHMLLHHYQTKYIMVRCYWQEPLLQTSIGLNPSMDMQ